MSRLRVSGQPTKEQFYNLCDNKHPLNGQKLTPRNKADRTIAYDLNFHACKSLSVLMALSDDPALMLSFQSSVSETMDLIEADAMVRVRKDGKYADRKTGELLYNTFYHMTARPVGNNAPDPHVHAHVVVQNISFDVEEGRYKAGQFRTINSKMPLYQTIFHKKLSDKLIAAGYKVRRTEHSFELEIVPEHIIRHFSRRTNYIGQIAKEKGITNAKELSELGARTREKKNKGMSMAELKTDWRRQIFELEASLTKNGDPDTTPEKVSEKEGPNNNRQHLPGGVAAEVYNVTSQDCVNYALLHCFERASVTPYNQLLLAACRFGIGSGNISIEAIDRQLSTDSRLISITERDKVLCTTKEVLAEEKRMIDGANAGKGKFAPLYSQAPKLNLDGQQAEAVKHILTTKDMVSIIRGAAGAGKTTLMKEAIPAINAAGKEVIVVAPSAQASRSTLRKEVDHKADTVARLLVDTNMQDRLQNQVLWVDEAPLLSTRQMSDLIDLARQKQARLVLGGDVKQHNSVLRGDSVRILTSVGGIHAAEVNQIYRQKNGLYKSAVEDLSKGDTRQGFNKLDSLGFIREVDPLNSTEALVEDYSNAVRNGKSCLVIAPTHKQGLAVTTAIRQKLKESGHIDSKEIVVFSLVNKNLTEAEKSDWRNYQPGQVVQFNQNMKHNVVRGSRWKVDQIATSEVQLQNSDGKKILLPKESGAKFDVFDLQELAIARGDKVRVTKNGFDNRDAALNNGQTFVVKSVKDNGNVELGSLVSDATYTIDRNFGHITHAHCVTSHFSQGQTVQEVFVSQPSSTFGATNAQQFYVSVSRAREKTTVYTDDKEALLARASEAGDRKSAMELLMPYERHMDYVQRLEQSKVTSPPIPGNLDKHTNRDYRARQREDYEPTL